MKVLVTGGRGFIGTHVIAELRSRDIEPVIYDREAREMTHPQFLGHTFLGDVRDEEAVRQAVYATDAVVHLAGVLGTQETVDDPMSAITTNIVGSLNVFKACRDLTKPCVYIAVGNHWMNNPYSITKTAAERFAFMANKEWHTQISVVRALNAYGPGQKAWPVRKLMPNLVKAALSGNYFSVYGDGQQIMDMIYVTDVAKILVEALVQDHGTWDHPFEAGSGKPTTVKDICREVYRQVGLRDPLVNHSPMRPGEEEDAVVIGDPETLKPLGIGPEQFVPLEEGVRKTIAWYKVTGA